MNKGGDHPDFTPGKDKITLAEKYNNPTTNLYTVFVEGDKIGRIQDLNVNVEKTDFNGKKLYPFSFKHLNPNQNPKYKATMTGDTETIVCARAGQDCYGFLQPSDDSPPFTLAYENGKTNVIKTSTFK